MDERLPVRQWILAAAGLAMIAGAGVVVLRDRAPAAAAAPRAAVPSGRTRVYVEHEGAKLKLHWNPDSADVRAAKGGAVVIADGGRESRMEMTPRELRAGVVSYWPDSREVAFRLELDGAAAGSVRASAEVEEKRPSPFAKTEAPRRRSVPIKRVQAQTARVEVEEPKRGSKFTRAVGKIPLLRRLTRREKP
jgi:hypothetical protein